MFFDQGCYPEGIIKRCGPPLWLVKLILQTISVKTGIFETLYLPRLLLCHFSGIGCNDYYLDKTR